MGQGLDERADVAGHPRPGADAAATSAGPPAAVSRVEWACLAAGLVLVVHYAWILDDAYVFFKYVDNLLFLESGLVYNRGEYVEGFSSPLWVLVLAALRASRLDYWLLVRALAVASYAVFWALLVRVNRDMASRGAPVLNLPLLLLTFNYGSLCYFSSGTESPLVQVSAGLYALLALRPASSRLQACVALTPLVRHELGLAFVLAALWVVWENRRIPWLMLAVCAATSGAWLAFRIYYYADLFPNTFYLKNQWEILQGLRYLHDTLAPYHLYELAGLAVAAALALRVRSGRWLPRGAARLAMLAIAAALTLYVVKIGGDARHYRYLVFPIALAACAAGGLAEAAWQAWLPRLRRSHAWLAAAAAAALFASAYPRQLERHPAWLASGQSFVDGIADAHHHRFHPRLPRLSPWGSGAAIELLPRYAAQAGATGWAGGREPLVRVLCWKHYEGFDRYSVHSLGLANAILARTHMPPSRPGHKRGLRRLGHDLADVVAWWGRPLAPGMHRAAVEAGVAAPWIAANLDSIETIERKIYNRHGWRENLALALRFPAPIEVHGARD